jgi:hypothetical protein
MSEIKTNSLVARHTPGLCWKRMIVRTSHWSVIVLDGHAKMHWLLISSQLYNYNDCRLQRYPLQDNTQVNTQMT